MAHFLRPRLRAENTGFQMDLVLQPAFVDCFREICRVGGGAAEDRCAEILHELELTVGVAGGHRKRETADLLRTAVQSHAAREQTVAVAVLQNIVPCSAGSHDRTRTAVAPQRKIVLGIERDHALAGGAACGMDPDTVGQRCGHQPKRIRVAQVVLCQKRQLFEIGKGGDILVRQTRVDHFLPVIRVVVPDSAERVQKSLLLPCVDLFP